MSGRSTSRDSAGVSVRSSPSSSTRRPDCRERANEGRRACVDVMARRVPVGSFSASSTRRGRSLAWTAGSTSRTTNQGGNGDIASCRCSCQVSSSRARGGSVTTAASAPTAWCTTERRPSPVGASSRQVPPSGVERTNSTARVRGRTPPPRSPARRDLSPMRQHASSSPVPVPAVPFRLGRARISNPPQSITRGPPPCGDGPLACCDCGVGVRLKCRSST